MWHTMHDDKKNEEKVEHGEPEIAQGDLLGNFIRRTDNDFRGVRDESLIGQDIGDDEEDEEEK